MSIRNIILALCLCISFSCKKEANTLNQTAQVVNQPQDEPGKATQSAVYKLTGNRILKGVHVEYWSASYNINDTTVADTMTYHFIVLNDSTIKYGNRKSGWIGEMKKEIPYKPPYANCVYLSYSPGPGKGTHVYYDTLQHKVVRYWDAWGGTSAGYTMAFIDILHE